MIAFDPNFDETTLDEDTELMMQVAAGDREAFEQLFQRNFRSTVRIIGAMMGCDVHSEDLAQDVFMRVYRSRQRYVPSAKFSTWLGTIIRNTVFNAKRSQSRRPVKHLNDLVDASLELQASRLRVNIDFAGEVDRQHQIKQVRAAVAQLPARQRTAIEWVHFRGKSYAGAAEAMQTTPKAVKSLLGRGRGNLGERFANDELS